MSSVESLTWVRVCAVDDLVEESGVAALLNGRQIAIFYLPDTKQRVFVIDNEDPVSGASVLARGIVGDVKGELVVASPLYKQHFSLIDGQCVELDAAVPVYDARMAEDGHVYIASVRDRL